ncbi:hypothetical protein HPB52_009266 [Rhipicephalus sanguineus]|uniref:Uncharacterized protein n=1 Tax=Rhipicephalus sanguineus TaxID=34632 RepID=A0A9D4Q5U2_RHISA|nr:hypothetical protein HPB52_009266 [Rhipicephalus sanguineus]
MYVGLTIDPSLTWIPAAKVATFKATKVQAAVGKLLSRSQGYTPRLALLLYDTGCNGRANLCTAYGTAGATIARSSWSGNTAWQFGCFMGSRAVTDGCFIDGTPRPAICRSLCWRQAAEFCGPSPQGPRKPHPPSETAQPTSFTSWTDMRC